MSFVFIGWSLSSPKLFNIDILCTECAPDINCFLVFDSNGARFGTDVDVAARSPFLVYTYSSLDSSVPTAIQFCHIIYVHATIQVNTAVTIYERQLNAIWSNLFECRKYEEYKLKKSYNVIYQMLFFLIGVNVFKAILVSSNQMSISLVHNKC